MLNQLQVSQVSGTHPIICKVPGRWGQYAAVVYMNCYIGSHIKAEGWSNWNDTENYKTTRFAEYKNNGPSADPDKRVNWSKQLTDKEAKTYDLKTFLQNWYPQNNKQNIKS